MTKKQTTPSKKVAEIVEKLKPIKITVPIEETLKTLDGQPLMEGEFELTLGMILERCLLADAKIEGFTLTHMERFEIARRIRNGKLELLPTTIVQLRLLLPNFFIPLVAGQCLELLGETCTSDL